MSEREKAKRVFLKILAASGGKVEGTVRLVKAFYFAHLEYWKATGLMLTDHKIIRLPNGPAPNNYRYMLLELADSQLLTKGEIDSGMEYDTDVYELHTDVKLDDKNPVDAAITAAAKFIEGKSGAELIRFTHENSISWKEAKEFQELDICLDSLTEGEYRAMKDRMARAREELSSAIRR